MYKAVNLFILILMALLILSCESGTDNSLTIEQAENYLEDRDYRLSIITLKKILRDNPDNAQARMLLAETYLVIGDGTSAEKELRRARELGLDNNELIALLAMAQMYQGNMGQAIETTESTVSNGDNPPTNILRIRADAYLSINEINKAIAIYRDILDSQPKNIPALLGLVRANTILQNREAVNSGISELKSIAEGDARIWELDGYILSQAEKYKEAELSYTKAIELLNEKQISRTGFIARLGIVNSQLKQREFANALDNLKSLLAVQPNNPQLKYLRSVIAFEQGDYVLAQEFLRQVLSEYQNHLPSRIMMGATQYALKNYEQAREYLQSVVNEIPSHVQARKMLANVHLKLSKPGEALSLLQGEGEDNTNDADLLAIMGRAALFSGEYEQGLSFYRRALDASPNKPSIRAELARIYLSQGDTSKAIEELEHITGDKEEDASKLIIYAHIRNQDFHKALELVEQLELKSPKDASIQLIRGDIEIARGERQKAKQYYLSALKYQDDYIPALLNLARIDFEDGNLKGSETWLKKVIVVDSNNMRALLGMSQIEERRGDINQALSWVEKASKANPAALLPVMILTKYLISIHQFDRARNVIEAKLDRYPDDARLIRLKVELLLAEGKTPEAIRVLNELISEQPQDAGHYEYLARIYTEQNQLDKSSTTLKSALDTVQNKDPIYQSLIKLETKRGNTKEALKYIDRLKKGEQKSIAYGLEGDVYLQQKDYKSAVTAYEKGFEIKESPQLIAKITQAKISANDPAGAKLTLDKWLSSHPEDTNLLTYAQFYMQIGDNVEAIKLYQQALGLNPKNPIANNNLSWLYYLVGDERALDYAKNAYELAPESADIMDTYGWLLVLNEDYDQGIELLRDALNRKKGKPEFMLHLASALVRKGGNQQEAEKLVISLRNIEDYKDNPEVVRLSETLGLD